MDMWVGDMTVAAEVCLSVCGCARDGGSGGVVVGRWSRLPPEFRQACATAQCFTGGGGHAHKTHEVG